MKSLIRKILEQEMKEGRPLKYSDEDLIDVGCKYKNQRDFYKNEPNLYSAAYRYGLMPKIFKDCNYKKLGNLLNRMVYMYIWDRPVVEDGITYPQAVYFGLTCDEDRRFSEHTSGYETSPGCKVGSSSVSKFISKYGKYDKYFPLTDGYIKAEIAAALEMCSIDHFRNDPEWKGNIKVVNKSDGGELGGCYSKGRPVIEDAENILRSEIQTPEQFAELFPVAYNWWSSSPNRKKIFNTQLKYRFFDDAPYTDDEIFLFAPNFNSREDFEKIESKVAKAARRKRMMDILFPKNYVYYNTLKDEYYSNLKELSDGLNIQYDEAYYIIRRNQENSINISLVPKEEYKKNTTDQNIVPSVNETRKIIKKILKEESEKDNLLKYFIKKWEAEKKNSKKLTFNPSEIKKLGLMKHFNKIRLGFIDYYEKNIGNPVDDVLKELTETTLTTDDIKKLGIDVGGYDFKFDIEDILTYDPLDKGSFGKIKPYVRIKEGTVTTIMHDNQTFDLTDLNNAEEHKYWHEVEYEVEDLISLFIEKKLLTYGFNLDDLDLVVYMYKNKSSLNETKMLPKNKFAKQWLSRYDNLKKYKSGDGRFIYLANDNGNIIVSVDKQINETGVSWEHIWSMLEKHFTEKETRRKIIGWLLDRYHLTDMGYVYDESQDMMGKIDSSDVLIESKQLTESKEKNKIKDYFFKKWTKQKEQGQTPKLSFKEIKSLGLTKYRNEIIVYYSEFMNLDPNDTNRRTEILKNYLLNNTFNENDITEMKDSFDDGKIEVKFNKVEFTENENQVKNYINLDIEFLVLSGSFYNQEENQTVNFSSTENPFDDFVQYFEFKEVIEQVVESFIFELIESFGFNINNDIDYISVKW
jgi:hypothetical protein